MKRIKCPKCGSSQAYVRIKTNKIVCNRCGKISDKERFK